jgi:hypothetical protein
LYFSFLPMAQKNRLETARLEQVGHFRAVRAQLDAVLDGLERDMADGVAIGYGRYDRSDSGVRDCATILSEILLETINLDDSLLALAGLEVSFCRLALVPEAMLAQRGVKFCAVKARLDYGLIRGMVQEGDVSETEVMARIDALSIELDIIFDGLADREGKDVQGRIGKTALRRGVQKALLRGFGEDGGDVG